MNIDNYWFKSSKFEIEPGEDDEINPRIFGRQLAIWLKSQLEKYGYTVEDIINEDWGRCLMCSRRPFRLWVACGNMTNLADLESVTEPPLPAKEDIVWTCFVVAEVPFWKRIFGAPDTQPAVAKLHADLGKILNSEPSISLVEEP